jgi:hypothetical protein
MVLAHGANKARIGTNQIDDKDPDGQGVRGVELAKQQQSFWQSYKFMNPVTKKVELKQMYSDRLDETAVCGRYLSVGSPVAWRKKLRRRVLMIWMATAAFTMGASAQEDPTNIVAAQIRAQGYKCESPQSATRDPQASKPDEQGWILQCESGSYRVRLDPDMAAKVEKIDKGQDGGK